jgi:hypothetical protein
MTTLPRPCQHPAVHVRLVRHPAGAAALHPYLGLWLKLVEVFFSIITRQALRRGSFPTVADLIAAIERFIDAWNDRCAPFTWTPRTPTRSSPRPPTHAAARHKQRLLPSTSTS